MLVFKTLLNGTDTFPCNQIVSWTLRNRVFPRQRPRSAANPKLYRTFL